MTDEATKTTDPAAPDIVVAEAPAQPEAPELPEGKTLRAYLFYQPALRCTDCGNALSVKVFDGAKPKGHDDNIRYQEILVLGVGHCQRCSVQVVGAIKGLS